MASVVEENTEDQSKTVNGLGHFEAADEDSDADPETRRRKTEENLEMKRVEPLRGILSPTSEVTSQDDLISDAKSSEETLWSPASSTASSSRRLLSSEQLPSLLRTKIRNQAKAAFAKGRESLQFNKTDLQYNMRIAREQQNELPEFYVDAEALDEKIERSLQLGAKYTNPKQTMIYRQDVQRHFIFGEDRDQQFEDGEVQEIEVHFAKPRPRNPEDLSNFNRMCIVHKRKSPLIASTEENYPCFNCAEGIFVIKGKVDTAILAHRCGQEFVSGELDDGAKHIIDNPQKFEASSEDSHLCRYIKGEDWKAATSRFAHEDFVQLDVVLGKLLFTHHWLFNEEEMICSDIQQFHSVQTFRANEILKLLQEVIFDKQRLDRLSDSDAERNSLQQNLEKQVDELKEKQNRYTRISRKIEDKWRSLEMIRKRQQYCSTVIQLQRIPLDEGHLFSSQTSELAEHLQMLSETPIFTITESAEQESAKPKEEIERLKQIRKVQVQIQIFFNDIPVCKTEFHPLDKKFCVAFNQAYKLQIHDVPESITMTLLEKDPVGNVYPLAKIGLPLPDETKVTNYNLPLETMQFASDKVIHGCYGSVGGGDDRPCIAGILYCSSSWAKQQNFNSRNKKSSKTVFNLSSKKTDRFELLPGEVKLCNDEEFESYLRFNVSAGQNHSYNAKKISNLTFLLEDLSQTVTSSFDLYEKGKLNSQLDILRYPGINYALLTRSKLCDRFSKGTKTNDIEDVIREEPIPTFFGAFSAVFKSDDTSRKLKPMRKTKTTGEYSSDSKYRIIINLQSAVNLPLRLDGKLQPFVEVSFQKKAVCSQVVGGRNPNWQETLEISINELATHANKWDTITDKLQIYFYDQVITKLGSDEREPNTVHEQLERHCIGYIHIPFAALRTNLKIGGHLRIDTPTLLSSYRLSESPCYMKMLVILLPTVSNRLMVSPYSVFGIETVQEVKQCMEWESKLKKKFIQRRFISLVFDSSGQSVIASRYLRAIKPPSGLVASSTPQFARAACRVVSYIPFTYDYSSLNCSQNIWASADQFLAVGCGDEGEHAVLLCCWLLAANIEAYLLFGTSLPEGAKGAYVMAVFSNQTLLLNPVSGCAYQSEDPLCPLISVGTVVTENNIFGNIQSHEHPSLLQFDLTKTACWSPLFAKRTYELRSIQPEALMYDKIEESIASELRSTIERAIKLEFDKARTYGIPQWNLLATRAFRELLSDMQCSSEPVDVDRRLAQLRATYQLNLTVFQQRYSSVEDLVDKVMRLNLHFNSNPNAQFALAVHIEPFVNNIISCSVAIATLISY